MRAIVTKEFKGLADGDKTERYFVEGEIIGGELAKQAIADGNAAKDAPETSAGGGGTISVSGGGGGSATIPPTPPGAAGQ